MKKLIPGNNEKVSTARADALVSELAIDTMARTLWGEARGEGSAGMQAVANVIMNRLAHAKSREGFWWGSTIIQICQKPYQFSCWNRDDANFPKLMALDGRDIHFATALRIARRAVAGVLADMTSGATHYHAAGITPYWAKNKAPCTVIGRHIFYRIAE